MSNAITIVRSSDLPAAPWRNGGGLTREVASASDAEGLVWRISLADVTAEGPFSAFEGYQRILTVIEGAGMRYDRPGLSLEAAPLVPVPFDGAPPVTGRLPHGPVRNVNLTYRPGAVRAEVAVIEGPRDISLDAGPDGTLALHAVAGEVSVGDAPLAAGSTALAGQARVALGPGACIVAVTLCPCEGAPEARVVTA